MWHSIRHDNETISIRLFVKDMIDRIKHYDQHLAFELLLLQMTWLSALLQLKSFDCNYQNLQNKEKKIYSLQPFFHLFILHSKMSLTKADPNKQGWEDSVSGIAMAA